MKRLASMFFNDHEMPDRESLPVPVLQTAVDMPPSCVRMKRLASMFFDDHNTPDVEELPVPVIRVASDVPGMQIRGEALSTCKNASSSVSHQGSTLAIDSAGATRSPQPLDSGNPIATYVSTLNRRELEAMNIKLKLNLSCKTTGKHFGHFENVAKQFIEANGGNGLCVVKVGICAAMNLIRRCSSYKLVNLNAMIVPCISYDLTLIESMEAHGIRILSHLPGCRNESPGGESMRRKDGSPRFDGPYCAYVVADRADSKYPIGS